jgi:uncharacterized membrane protein
MPTISPAPAPRFANRETLLRRLPEIVRRAFVEFLKIPALIILGFLLLAAAATVLDYLQPGVVLPFRTALRSYFFRNGQATSDLLATIAGSIITVVSITFSLLLLAVQQAAGALTHEVYDQFLRRRINQVYFGFFVGLALYTLIILATVDQPYNPVFGATLALLLTLVALVLVIVLLYTTVNQMRPVVVIDKIHDHVLHARDGQLSWLGRARSTPESQAALRETIRSEIHGYVTDIDVAALASACEQAGDGAEVVLHLAIGAFVAFNDEVAEVRADAPESVAELADAARRAIRIEQQRDLEKDAAYGLEQLAIIAWTSVSTAKSNPSPGLLVLHSLRDLTARWSASELASTVADPPKELPIVYQDDVPAHLFDALEAIAVVASESMQPQTTAEFVRTLAQMFRRLPTNWQDRAEQSIRRFLSALGEQVLTGELETALAELATELAAAERPDAAADVAAALEALRASVGRLGSRATRVQGR